MFGVVLEQLKDQVVECLRHVGGDLRGRDGRFGPSDLKLPEVAGGIGMAATEHVVQRRAQ